MSTQISISISFRSFSVLHNFSLHCCCATGCGSSGEPGGRGCHVRIDGITKIEFSVNAFDAATPPRCFFGHFVEMESIDGSTKIRETGRKEQTRMECERVKRTKNRFKFPFCALHPSSHSLIDVWRRCACVCVRCLRWCIHWNRLFFTCATAIIIIYSVRIHLLIIREWDINTTVLNCLPLAAMQCDGFLSFASLFLFGFVHVAYFTARATKHLMCALHNSRPSQCTRRNSTPHFLDIQYMVRSTLNRCVFWSVGCEVVVDGVVVRRRLLH